MKTIRTVFLLLALLIFPDFVISQTTLPLDKIKLPTGFQISVFADDVTNARSMALSPNGTLFVGTRREGKVYAVVDGNHDYKADRLYTIASG